MQNNFFLHLIKNSGKLKIFIFQNYQEIVEKTFAFFSFSVFHGKFKKYFFFAFSGKPQKIEVLGYFPEIENKRKMRKMNFKFDISYFF